MQIACLYVFFGTCCSSMKQVEENAVPTSVARALLIIIKILIYIDKIMYWAMLSYQNQFDIRFNYLPKIINFSNQKITAMDLFCRQEPKQCQIETPVKKGKGQFNSEVKTAESCALNQSPTLRDIEAEELFDNFNQIVKISETNEQYEENYDPYRRLDFEDDTNVKLNFDQSTASMRKKNKIKKESIRQSCKIKPFILLQEVENEEERFQHPKETKKDQRQIGTPPHKTTKPEELLNAARKQDPFRDLSNQKQ